MRRVSRFLPVCAVVVVAGLALGTAHAQSPRVGRSAVACSKQTINGGRFIGTVSYRFVLHGHVGCAEAHRTLRAYLRAVGAGRCPTRICTGVTFPGGWTCSSTSAAEQQSNGGLLAGCSRPGARFGVYRAQRVKQAIVFSPAAYGLACQLIDDGTAAGSWVYCWVGTGTHPARHVKLGVNGRSSAITTVPIPLGIGGPTLAYGRQVRVGRFRCRSLSSGMRCTVISSGRGFLFSRGVLRMVSH